MISGVKPMVEISWLACGCIAFVVCHTIYWCARYNIEHGFDPNGQLVWVKWDMSILTCVNTFLTAYLVVPMVWPGIRHLQGATTNKIMRVYVLCMVLAWVVYSLMGELSYLTLFDENDGDLILNYYPQETIVTIAKIAVILLMFASLPIVMNPARYVLTRQLWMTKKRVALSSFWCPFPFIGYLSAGPPPERRTRIPLLRPQTVSACSSPWR